VLAEYLLPFARIGGYCVAMKGETAMQEVEDAHKALELLGGKLVKVESVELPDVTEKHYLVVIEKTSKTPSAFPRKPGIPSKKPLS
jgi:16S rRNA (guanine527-N7)-methyltransferase